MIEALMYGITPSAKIVICARLLPENMLYSPNIVFWVCAARIASASVFTPGVGTTPPTRYTPSNPSVKSTRLRRSVTAKRFLSGLSIALITDF
jgi:hypothetical protein